MDACVACRLVFAVGSHRDFALPFWHDLQGRDLADRGYQLQDTGEAPAHSHNVMQSTSTPEVCAACVSYTSTQPKGPQEVSQLPEIVSLSPHRAELFRLGVCDQAVHMVCNLGQYDFAAQARMLLAA